MNPAALLDSHRTTGMAGNGLEDENAVSEQERGAVEATNAGAADEAKSGLAALPARPAGSLTNDLSSDTDDVMTLRQRLDRARERLSFYESFDRIIQENIRRSSELMIEATELHERAERAISAQAEAQAALDRQRARDRAHYAALLGDLRAELDRTRAALDGLTAQVTGALAGLSAGGATEQGSQAQGSATAATVDTTAGEESTSCAPDAPVSPEPQRRSEQPASTSARAGASTPAAAAPAPAAPPPRPIDVLLHGVPTARIAISFQNHLRGLEQVREVEAREFVEGLLRLQVTATGELNANDLAGWTDGAGAETLRALPDLLEISLPGTTER